MKKITWKDLNEKKVIIYGMTHNNFRKKKEISKRPIVGHYLNKTRKDLDFISDNLETVLKAYIDGTLKTVLPSSKGRHALYVLIDEKIGWKEDASRVYLRYHAKNKPDDEKTKLSNKRMEYFKTNYKEIFDICTN